MQNPLDRPSAKQLLTHPFIKTAGTIEKMLELVDMRNKAREEREQEGRHLSKSESINSISESTANDKNSEDGDDFPEW